MKHPGQRRHRRQRRRARVSWVPLLRRRPRIVIGFIIQDRPEYEWACIHLRPAGPRVISQIGSITSPKEASRTYAKRFVPFFTVKVFTSLSFVRVLASQV